jgi:FAD/FMN-containing dehydrogenase
VVTASGDVMHGLCGLRKDNTGYDLRDLFIGSEGTLGVITAATLALQPRPAATMTALAACASLDACVALLGAARRRLGPGLTGFEVMNALSLELVARHLPQLKAPLAASPWSVLLELSDNDGETPARERFEALLGDALEQGVIGDAAIAANMAQSRAMWHLREAIPLAQAEEGLNIKHDIALPVSKIPAFCAAIDAALMRAIPGVRLVNFGHLGDGNLHYNVQGPVGEEAAAFLAAHETRANHIVYDAVSAHGGSISAEHGIGVLKREELPLYKDATALALMRAVKSALDPLNLLNPGRVL